jgi:amino acid transporter
MSGASDTSDATGAQHGREGAMTVRDAVFMGVGSMVGAGIFALLGEAGAVAGAAMWLSFLIAGIIATLQGYAVAKLGARGIPPPVAS